MAIETVFWPGFLRFRFMFLLPYHASWVYKTNQPSRYTTSYNTNIPLGIIGILHYRLMNEIEIYKTKDGKTEVEVRFDEDTVWLSQPQLVTLFKSSKTNVSEHLTSIFRTGELDKKSTVRKFRTVRPEGKRMVTRNTAYYSLDVIISIGYRINTKRGIQFRQWATQRLKDYLVT